MKYSVVIENMQIVEVEATSEEQAIQNVKNQLDIQDPKNTARLSIAKEVEIK